MNKRLQSIIELLKADAASGVLLILCVVCSLLIANSSLFHMYNHIWENTERFTFLGHDAEVSLADFINDGLMAVFFLFVGLEIKREITDGQLSTFKKAALPVCAALGGIVIPALIYIAFNHGTNKAQGWAIPTATDIAFAIAVLSILGNKVRLSHKIFIKALAIVDDLGAIVIIAMFYATNFSPINLGAAFGVFAFQFLLNRLRVNVLWPYLASGVLLWYFIHQSGIHPTIAGVLTAFAIPYGATNSPLEKLEHWLVTPVNYIIMPLFALANTNIHIGNFSMAGFASPVSAGIIFGLVIGKPVGITIFTWLSTKLKIAELPQKTSYKQIAGIGILGGIGFTMSIFITLLSFNDPVIQNDAKIFILVASLIAAITGYFALNIAAKRRETKRVVA
ncbi:Na+/H+ antiporter NhaA [Mucilaginibacter polytrichastri]|uniref:Na(+)/H(+) antiporter NhaA n=1 Tax=Mucilaginibacter polytrichastri TaxID=1302689 RepID=A0A1Q5ZX69_9SPHI|nr:Na+/H+ antiporter NhaA [Mucilaginibacter polytrichastri]OKS86351.1 Na(+)/H(+) antiporter nhaA 2 [Mucilaginibacter polytrichastri]SFT21016.1 Na+:H+ antiporter, NhaA family [Mucilaginibacter polytrichastri]